MVREKKPKTPRVNSKFIAIILVPFMKRNGCALEKGRKKQREKRSFTRKSSEQALVYLIGVNIKRHDKINKLIIDDDFCDKVSGQQITNASRAYRNIYLYIYMNFVFLAKLYIMIPYELMQFYGKRFCASSFKLNV